MVARTFCPGGVHFDGLSSLVNASMTSADSSLVTVSMWFKAGQTQVNTQATFLECNPDSYSMKALWLSAGVLQMSFANPTGSPGGLDIFQLTGMSEPDYFDGAWHNWLVSANMSSSSPSGKIGAMIVDGVDKTGTKNSFGSVPGVLTMTGLPFYIATDTFGDEYTGDMMEVWVMPGLNILTGSTIAPADIAKFYDGACPVDLGTNGEIPTGSPPPIYLRRGPSDPASAFLTNQGTGGNFSINAGSLTTAEGPCACSGGQTGQGYVF